MKAVIVFGTRPEIIKLAPVYFAAKSHEEIECLIVSSGQHDELAKQSQELFGIIPDFSLKTMTHGQSLNSLFGKVFSGLSDLFGRLKPDVVIVQGDTLSALAAALAASMSKIKVAHVEAGLRSGDKNNPFPEETNRLLISKTADLHFAPTQSALENLINEGVEKKSIIVTGNTIVDAVKYITSKPNFPNLKQDADRIQILATLHRRENIGDRIAQICEALRMIVEQNTRINMVFPVHPNPSVRQIVFDKLDRVPQIELIEPVDYLSSLSLISQSLFMISDSGGMQEEAACFGKPIIICRETTERPEILLSGLGVLAGASVELILNTAERWLSKAPKMAAATNPFGDGNAAERIVDSLLKAGLENASV